MAQIEITPLNINGVKVPFNLLDTFLGQQINYTNLVYPIDLATNPQYCHAIQFTIYNYEYPVAEGAYQQISGLLDKGVVGIGNILGKFSDSVLNASIPNATLQGVVKSGISYGSSLFNSFQNTNYTALGKEVAGGLTNFYQTANISAPLQTALQGAQNITSLAPSELNNLLTNYTKYLQPGSYMNRTKEKLASVSLYMPDSLNTSISSNYDPVNLTDTFKIAGYGANAAADYLKNKDPLSSNPSNILSEDLKRGGIGALIGGDLGTVIGNALKRVPNPQVQLMYRGVGLREFQFEFTFTPATQKEAEEIDQIIKTFTYYSLPELSSGMNGQFFIPPQIFGIKFAFMGNDGVAGQIYDVFKNNITNILGNQFTKIITGGNQANDIAKAKTAKIFEIGDCVLKDIQVNYAPNGWASYTDGYPVQTTISLTFGEINVIHKQTPGVAPRTVVTPASPIPGPISDMFPKGSKTLSDLANGKLPIGIP